MAPDHVSNSPAITTELLDAISDEDVRAKVSLIIDLCVNAVGRLDSLDHGIHQQAQELDVEGNEQVPGTEHFARLAATVLGGVRALGSHLLTTDTSDKDAEEDDGVVDFDFDLGGEPATSEDAILDDLDIDSVLDGFAPQTRKSGDERWAALSSELMSFGYALTGQLEQFDERFAVALERGRVAQALRELDDVGNALIDGVFALMSTVCETYLGAFDRNRMLPGHRDTLGKALLVRRGVADLRRSVKAVNPEIQDTAAPALERQAGIDLVAAELLAFIEGEVWRAMRPADRLELQNFREEIAGSPTGKAALCCEGLDKYLDSLLSVNQRDVLIRHDRELMAEIAAILEGVRPIADISPHGAMDMVRQAFDKAQALRGYHDPFDTLMAEWANSVAETSELPAMVEISTRLSAIAKAALK